MTEFLKSDLVSDKGELGTAKLIGPGHEVKTMLALQGEYTVSGAENKTVDIPLPPLPTEKTWKMAYAACSVKGINDYTAGDPVYVLGVIGSFADGNKILCGYNNAKMTLTTSCNSNGTVGYYQSGTVLSLQDSQTKLRVGYVNSGRDLYWPDGATIQWYLVLAGT